MAVAVAVGGACGRSLWPVGVAVVLAIAGSGLCVYRYVQRVWESRAQTN